MYRKPAIFLLISSILMAGAFRIGKAQGPISQVPEYTSPLPIKQTADRGQSENGKGNISGRVVNEQGEPVVGLVVDVEYGRRGEHPEMRPKNGPIETDEEGRFHVPDLSPGEYILSVSRPCCRGGDPIPPDEAKEAPYYQTEIIYYKDTPDRKDAVAVQVKANSETAVEITRRLRPLHKLSGTVFNRDGQPVPRALLLMIRKQKPDIGSHSQGVSTEADAQGKWSFDVPDGVYVINAFKINWTSEGGKSVSRNQGLPMPSQILPSSPSQQLEASVSEQAWQVTVSGADMPNVVIEMKGRAQVVSGRVVLEDGSPIPSEDSIDVGLGSDWHSNSVAANGSFELKGRLLGEEFLNVIRQPFGKYYVKSITWNGADYLRAAFEFGNGVDYKGVEVVLSTRGTLLEGSVKRTTPSKTGGQVWLIPEDEKKWRAPLTWSSSPINPDGTFTIYAAPGGYLILLDEGVNLWFAAHDLDRAEDYVREHAPRARHLTLKAGERQTVGL